MIAQYAAGPSADFFAEHLQRSTRARTGEHDLVLEKAEECEGAGVPAIGQWPDRERRRKSLGNAAPNGLRSRTWPTGRESQRAPVQTFG